MPTGKNQIRKKLPSKITWGDRAKYKKKLPLSIEEEVIERGKAFAKTQGVSLSKLFEQFILDHLPPEREPVSVIEPDPEILTLLGKPATPPKHKTHREYYDEYYEDRRAPYIKNSKTEEEWLYILT